MNAPIKAPRLIVGLGNPGSEYENTRHNVGFWLINQLAQSLKIPLSTHSKFFGIVGKFDDCWFLQPTTFMNRSGQAVLALAQFYKILPDEILVIHDDLDLLPGAIKIKQGGGNGGHNGLKDISARLSTPDFWRLRLGIGHPGDRNEVINYVLKAPRREEEELILEAINRCLIHWNALKEGDFAKAQRNLHGVLDKK